MPLPFKPLAMVLAFQRPASESGGSKWPWMRPSWSSFVSGCVINQALFAIEGFLLVLAYLLRELFALAGLIPLVDVHALGFQLSTVGIEIGLLCLGLKGHQNSPCLRG